MRCGQVRSGKEQLADARGIWRCEEDFSWGGALVIGQRELLALGAMVKCCHDLDLLFGLLLCNNLTHQGTLMTHPTQSCVLAF